MSRTVLKALTVFGLFALVALGSLAFSCTSIPEDIGLAGDRLRPCPESPNCVCSEDAGLDSSIEAFAYDEEPAAAFAALLALVSDQGGELVTTTDTYAHAVFTTPLMRFRDDLELRLDAAHQVVHVRSASRVGHSDLGANRARVETLRAAWLDRAR